MARYDKILIPQQCQHETSKLKQGVPNLSVVFVLDVTGSMDQVLTPVQTAFTDALASLQRSGWKVCASAIPFAETVLRDGILPMTNDPASLLRAMSPQGTSNWNASEWNPATHSNTISGWWELGQSAIDYGVRTLNALGTGCGNNAPTDIRGQVMVFASDADEKNDRQTYDVSALANELSTYYQGLKRQGTDFDLFWASSASTEHLEGGFGWQFAWKTPLDQMNALVTQAQIPNSGFWIPNGYRDGRYAGFSASSLEQAFLARMNELTKELEVCRITGATLVDAQGRSRPLDLSALESQNGYLVQGASGLAPGTYTIVTQRTCQISGTQNSTIPVEL